MIKSITVTNHRNESIVLDLRSPEQSGFFIKGVDGLGPTKADINTTEALALDGSIFNSSRQTFRNIVFTLGFLENPSIEASRQNSYKYFPLQRKVDIVVETDVRTLRTEGYVESNEPNIFSKEEASNISIICPEAFFKSLTSITVPFSSTQSLFSFPFSNESLTEKLIIFGNLELDPQKVIDYTGEVSTGFIMHIHALGPVGTLTIRNLDSRETMTIDNDILESLTGYGLVDGDDIIISTTKGHKSVLLVRGGETFNILNALGPDSSWFSLNRGFNTFYFTADSGSQFLQFSIEYNLLYEGI